MDKKAKKILDHLQLGESIIVKRLSYDKVWVWKIPITTDQVLCHVIDDTCIKHISNAVGDLPIGVTIRVNQDHKGFYEVCKYAALGQTFSGGIGRDEP